jgi:hypothetical protein
LAEPGKPVLDDVIVVGANGENGSWTVPQLVSAKPSESKHILERSYINSNGKSRRNKEIDHLPSGSTELEVGIIPIKFLGDD